MSLEVGHRLGLGNVYMGMNRLDLAVQQYQLAIEMDPSCLQAVYNYAYAISLLGDSRAEEFLEAQSSSTSEKISTIMTTKPTFTKLCLRRTRL